MRHLGDPDVSWIVYEHTTATCWRVNPDTRENALREAALCGLGHTAMLLEQGRDLANAFAAGRMYGHQQARQQAAARARMDREPSH